jgi:hypothetical protein
MERCTQVGEENHPPSPVCSTNPLRDGQVLPCCKVLHIMYNAKTGGQKSSNYSFTSVHHRESVPFLCPFLASFFVLRGGFVSSADWTLSDPLPHGRIRR